MLTGRTKDYVTSVHCMVDVAGAGGGTAVRDSVGWEMWGTVLVGDVEDSVGDSVGGRCGGQCGGWPLGCRDELIRRYPVARVQICDFSHNTQHLTQIGTKLRFKKKKMVHCWFGKRIAHACVGSILDDRLKEKNHETFVCMFVCL